MIVLMIATFIFGLLAGFYMAIRLCHRDPSRFIYATEESFRKKAKKPQ